MNDKLQDFYLKKEEPNKSCLLALREILLECNSEITECVKYGMPCFCLGKQAVCYLWTDKKTHEPYILFVDGNKLNFPELETGDRARMKIYRINPLVDIPKNQIELIVKSALELV